MGGVILSLGGALARVQGVLHPPVHHVPVVVVAADTRDAKHSKKSMSLGVSLL